MRRSLRKPTRSPMRVSCQLTSDSGHLRKDFIYNIDIGPVLASTALHRASRTEKMVDAAKQFFTEILSAGNSAFLEEIAVEDVVYRDRAWMERDIVSCKKLRRYLEDLQRGYPDMLVHLDTVFGQEDSNTVMAHWACRASNLGEFRGDPASGRVSVWSGVTVFAFDSDCLIKEVVVYRQPTEDERIFYFGWEHL